MPINIRTATVSDALMRNVCDVLGTCHGPEGQARVHAELRILFALALDLNLPIYEGIQEARNQLGKRRIVDIIGEIRQWRGGLPPNKT